MGQGAGLGVGGEYKFWDSLETAPSKSTPGALYKRINSMSSFSSLSLSIGRVLLDPGIHTWGPIYGFGCHSLAHSETFCRLY